MVYHYEWVFISSQRVVVEIVLKISLRVWVWGIFWRVKEMDIFSMNQLDDPTQSN